MESKMKYCSKCDSTKPLSEFGKHRRRKDGLSLWCKSCKSAYDAEYRQKNKETISKSKAEWYQNNKEHCDQKTKRWVSENKDRRKEIVNQSYQNNKESKLKYSKEYRQSNPQVCADRIKNWEARNPDRVRAKNARRRVAKLNAEPSWLTQEQQGQITFLYGVAKDCELMTGDKYHVDHIVPLQGKNVCGLHVPWNLQVLPADINQEKSNKFDDKTTETYC